jgi:23S rRNA (guanosine2251-2'-O)-methyltransferase
LSRISREGVKTSPAGEDVRPTHKFEIVQAMAQIIYGIHPVEEALKSPRIEFERILVGAGPPGPALRTLLDFAARRKIEVIVSARGTLDQMAKGGLHQNIIGLVREVSYIDLEEILSRWKTSRTRALLLILDGIQDPQNLGSLIRTALGCGAHGLVIPKDRAAGITPAAVKASAGATVYLPVARVVNIATTLDLLKKEGIWVFGAAGEAENPVYDLDLNIDLAVVIGGEGKGIRPLVKKRCDRLFSIPMKGPVSSFNASVSGGMILYEVMRQREKLGRSVQIGNE